MSIKQPEWTKLLVGPNVQEDGTDKGRQPNLNFGTGLSISTDSINKRHTVSIDSAVNPTPNWLNIKSFGAVGDRVNNDTSAIVAAIASATLANAPVRTVFFPSGTYRITGPLAFANTATDVLLLGEPGATIYSEYNSNNVITIQGSRCGARGLRMVLSGSPSGGAQFRLVGNDTFIENCIAENAWTGFFMSTGRRQRLRGNVVTDAQSIGIAVGSTGFPSTKSIVEDNFVLFSSGNCMQVHDCRDVVITNNLLHSGSDNVTITGNAQRVVFTDNIIGGATDDGLTIIIGASHCIITDNVIENCFDNPMDIDPQLTGSIIKNNRFQNCGTDRIRFSSLCAIAGGVLQIPGDIDQVYEIDTEGGSIIDDLDTILGGRNGQRSTFRISNNGRIVTFKNATGNLRLQGDWTPDNTNSRLELEYNGEAGTWSEISRNNLATGGSGGSGGADPGVQYVTMGTTGSLPNERVLTAGTGLTRTDGGAGGNVTLAVNNSVVATLTGSNFTGGLSGSVGLALSQQTTPPVSASANTVSIHAFSGSAGRVPYAVNDQGRASTLAPFPTHRVNGTVTPGGGLVTPLTIPIGNNSFANLGIEVVMWTPGTTTLLNLQSVMRVTRSLGGNAFKLATPVETRSTNSSSLFCSVDVSGTNAVVQLSASHANTAYEVEAWFRTKNLPT